MFQSAQSVRSAQSAVYIAYCQSTLCSAYPTGGANPIEGVFLAVGVLNEVLNDAAI
jgi:hypothetical protein